MLFVVCCAIECHPGHDLRMDEVLPSSSHFPNSFVRFPPSGRQMFEHGRACSKHALRWLHTRLARLEHGVLNFPEDIDLQLLCGRIADAYGRRVLITGEPG